MKNLLDKWINAIKRIAKVSKDKEAFKQRMLIGHRGYYSTAKYFAYELDKWINEIKRRAKVSKDKEAFKQRMLIGHRGYYSTAKYFAYEGVIYIRMGGVDSYPIDILIGVYDGND